MAVRTGMNTGLGCMVRELICPSRLSAQTSPFIKVSPAALGLLSRHFRSAHKHSKDVYRRNIALVVLLLYVCFTDVMNSFPTQKRKKTCLCQKWQGLNTLGGINRGACGLFGASLSLCGASCRMSSACMPLPWSYRLASSLCTSQWDSLSSPHGAALSGRWQTQQCMLPLLACLPAGWWQALHLEGTDPPALSPIPCPALPPC